MSEAKGTERLETFCDGVFAIAMTLLIIDVKLPPLAHNATTGELWSALLRLTPSVFAFVLSFTIIFITWVNHHATLEIMRRSSASFMYANGLLLLAVVFIPFPTALLGEYLLTDHSVPSVVLYDAALASIAIGWILVTHAALKNDLTTGETAAATIRENNRNAYFAFALYSLLAVAALWFPLAIAVVTTVSWIFWLVLGIRMKHA